MTSDRRTGAVGEAGAYLAEILAMSLIERGVVEKDEVCTELDMLAGALAEDGKPDVAAALLRLASSLRAGDEGVIEAR